MTPGVKSLLLAIADAMAAEDKLPAPTFSEMVNVATAFELDELSECELLLIRQAHSLLPSTGSRAMVAACDQMLDELANLNQRVARDQASTKSAFGDARDPFSA